MMCSLGDETYLNLIKIKRADNMAKADPHAIDEKLKNMRSFYEEIKINNECYNLKSLAVNGDDIKAFGIAEGKEIKSSLDFLLNGVIEGKCQNRKDVIVGISERKYKIIKSTAILVKRISDAFLLCHKTA